MARVENEIDQLQKNLQSGVEEMKRKLQILESLSQTSTLLQDMRLCCQRLHNKVLNVDVKTNADVTTLGDVTTNGGVSTLPVAATYGDVTSHTNIHPGITTRGPSSIPHNPTPLFSPQFYDPINGKDVIVDNIFDLACTRKQFFTESFILATNIKCRLCFAFNPKYELDIFVGIQSIDSSAVRWPITISGQGFLRNRGNLTFSPVWKLRTVRCFKSESEVFLPTIVRLKTHRYNKPLTYKSVVKRGFEENDCLVLKNYLSCRF